MHFVSATCGGEICGMCYRLGIDRPATHKVGEEIPDDAPFRGHNLTQYVCCEHFGSVVGPGSASIFRECEPEAD